MASGEEGLAVGGGQLLAGQHVPDVDGRFRGDDEAAIVGGEGDALCALAVFTEFAEQLAGGGLPDADWARVAAGEQLAVGRERQAVQVLRFHGDFVEAGAGPPVPQADDRTDGVGRGENLLVRREDRAALVVGRVAVHQRPGGAKDKFLNHLPRCQRPDADAQIVGGDHGVAVSGEGGGCRPDVNRSGRSGRRPNGLTRDGIPKKKLALLVPVTAAEPYQLFSVSAES